MTIAAGTRLGRYEIRSKLGEGGMGEVYLAEDTKLNRKVAIKVLPVDLIASEQAGKRLLREARAAATLDHPNICAVHEVAEENGRSFIVMQYVEGETLEARMKRKPFEMSESLSLATQVADALAEAHAHGIIHRDIKPSNIMLASRGQAKVMDFGLAKLIQHAELVQSEAETEALISTPGTIIGTVPYMSPEQVRAEALDGRSDIFSFGVVFYEMLSGQQPFAGRSSAATASAILTHEPPPLARFSRDIPNELERIVSKALRKDPDERYQTAKDLLIDLRSLGSELEFQHRLERSTPPDSGRGISVAAGSPPAIIETAEQPVARTVRAAVTDHGAKRPAFLTSRLGLALAAIVMMASVASIYALFFRSPRSVPGGSAKSVDSAAYDYYLRGKLNASSENRENNESAIRVLEQVVKADPSFAPAYAELARAYGIKANFFASGADKKKLNEDAKLAVEHSLALDPDLAEGHFVRGYLLWTHDNRFPHEQAIQSYKRAIALDPNLEEAHHHLGVVYFHIGLLDRAEEEIRKALAINPSDTLARFRLGSINVCRGKYEEALAILKTVPREANPAIVDRATAIALFQLGRTQEASEVVENYLKTFSMDEGGNVTSVKAMLLAKAGQDRETEETIQRAIEIGQSFQHFHHTTYNIASAYALLNKPDEALKWLQFTADDGFPCYPLFENDANLNSLRKDERFITFMAKLKQQWERYQATL